MATAEPSYGYSVLAQIMATTPHRAAITTNFDNLIADALSIYTDAFPLVCGHESLTGYIRAKLRRPLIAKVHRDLLLEPFSQPGEIKELDKGWETALKRILDGFTPIVIGYGGNDGSLMGFLKKTECIAGGIYWCHMAGEKLCPDVNEVVERHRGRLVEIAGFDELMLQLWDKLKLESPINQAKIAHDKRVLEFQEQFEALNKKMKEPAGDPVAEAVRAPVREAAAAAVERLTKEESWWAWQLKADAESDPVKAEAVYREGLKDFQKSAELVGNFAVFMEEVRKDYDEAERLYRKALELDPKNTRNTGNFADFMEEFRKDYDGAERLYRKALEIDSQDARNIGNFANFLRVVRNDYCEAERLYRAALEIDPKHAHATGNFAEFLWEVRQQYDEAERLYHLTLELDPKLAYYVGYYGKFMELVRKNYTEANRLYRRALELDPNEAVIKKEFARFLKEHPEFNQ